MGANTKIEWCSSVRPDGTMTPGYTWSPWRGCARVSTGCEKCYAEKMSHRNPAVLGEWGVNANRVINADWDKPLAWDRKAAKMGERHRVFPSLCDPFEDREDLAAPRARFLELIEKTPNLDWLVLTKRPENWRRLMLQIYGDLPAMGRAHNLAGSWLDGEPLPNLWFGVSAENQEYADKRLPELLKIPAKIRWVSYEPALGPVNFGKSISIRDEPGGWDTLNPLTGGMRGSRSVCSGSDRRINWIVCGGESGAGARPFDLAWAESVRDQCGRNGVAFYMKQVGANPRIMSDQYHPYGRIDSHITDPKGGDMSEFPPDLRIREFPIAS